MFKNIVPLLFLSLMIVSVVGSASAQRYDWNLMNNKNYFSADLSGLDNSSKMHVAAALEKDGLVNGTACCLTGLHFRTNAIQVFQKHYSVEVPDHLNDDYYVTIATPNHLDDRVKISDLI